MFCTSTFNARHFLGLGIATLVAFSISGVASAATINFVGTSVPDGDPVSGSADFTIDAGADKLTVKLTNTTSETLNAGQLFTGIDFDLGGLTPSLDSDTGEERTVANDGTFVDGGSSVDISWSLSSLGGDSYQLNFNPNAKHGIIGPPSGGNYSSANGSIKGNPGHNPFAAEMAVFELSVPGLEDDTPINVENFLFGTALNPARAIPEPATCVLALGMALAVFQIRRLA